MFGKVGSPGEVRTGDAGQAGAKGGNSNREAVIQVTDASGFFDKDLWKALRA